MEGQYIWKGKQSVETLWLKSQEGFIEANSLIEKNYNKKTFHIKYSIRLSSDWKVQEVKLESSSFEKDVVYLKSDLNGTWFNEYDEELPELKGCYDVDISVTPFTNTLPIRRLGNTLKSKQNIKVLYLDGLLGRYKKVTQDYLKLSPNLYRYEAGFGKFKTEIEVDENGLVINYPGLFKRSKNKPIF